MKFHDLAEMIVKKFPQIEQGVIAPALTREIRIALAQIHGIAEANTATHCAQIAKDEAVKCWDPNEEGVALCVEETIRERFGLDSESKVSPKLDAHGKQS